MPVYDRWIGLITVLITSSLMNMIMNETHGRQRMVRVGRDEIDFTKFMVLLQTELLIFGIESWVGVIIWKFSQFSTFL